MDSSFLCVAIYASHRNACVINYYGKLVDSDFDRVMRDGLEVGGTSQFGLLRHTKFVA